MKQLEELHIEDTTLDLTNLVEICKSCPNIVILSISLKQTMLDSIYGADEELLNLNFKKLISLRLEVAAVHYFDTWIVILQLLRYSMFV